MFVRSLMNFSIFYSQVFPGLVLGEFAIALFDKDGILMLETLWILVQQNPMTSRIDELSSFVVILIVIRVLSLFDALIVSDNSTKASQGVRWRHHTSDK